MGFIAKGKSKKLMAIDVIETALPAVDIDRICQLIAGDVDLKDMGWKDKINNKKPAMFWAPLTDGTGGSFHRAWISATDGHWKQGSLRDEAFRIDVRISAPNASGRRAVHVVTGRATLDNDRIRFVDNHEFVRDEIVGRILQLDGTAKLTTSRKDAS